MDGRSNSHLKRNVSEAMPHLAIQTVNVSDAKPMAVTRPRPLPAPRELHPSAWMVISLRTRRRH